ncbi:MAG TPA: carboxypeptidase-like regulatory domain-containing protein [Bryobacteraceae bacterium]|jgi:hypothetical protein|nr:carboxypeptidase-like regulatory domain-containing protein [Bryobacteraceae bacterium]
MLKLKHLSVLATLVACLGIPLFAQAPVGSITGTITDSSGAVVAGAAVTVSNTANGTNRALTANGQGLYSAPALPPGDYKVHVEREGFKTVERNAQVVAGITTTVDLAMTVGATREVVTVEAATAQITYDSHEVSGTIARETIQDIPLNGRSSLQLASLEPGVTISAGSSSQFNAQFNVNILGSGGGATAGSGVGPRITMDGGVINDEEEGGTSMNFSQEVVQEFQLASVNFDAATGIASTGSINIVTRSGSNDLHGSAYFYFRDHNMAAFPGLKRSSFNPNPFFARRNPGFWLGGPIVKDKLFFFVSYEHLNQTSVITDQNDLASLQPLNGIFPSPLTYNWLTTRFDYHLSDKNSIFLRYSHDGNLNFGPYAGTGNPSSWVHNGNWSDQTIGGLTTILSTNLVNDLRGQYKYWYNHGSIASPSDCTAPCTGVGLPGITSMIGSGTFTYGAGNDVNAPNYHQTRSYQILDTLSWQKGSHRIRFGMDYERTRTAVTPWDVCDPACIAVYSVEQTKLQGAAFPAGSFANLPATVSSSADLMNLPIQGQSAALYSGVSLGNGSWPGIYEPNQDGVNNRFHPWIADTWKVTQSLTVNYGLGYSYESGLFSQNLTRPAYLAPILNGQTGGVPSGLGATASQTKDFSPQFGFAYALGKDKKTVIRGGAGMYWDTQPIWEQFREDSSIGPVGDGRTTVAASAFTNIFPGAYQQTASGVQPLPVGAALPLNALSTITLGQFIQIINQQIPQLSAQLFGNTPTSGPYTTSGINVTKQGVEIYPSNFPFLRSYQTSVGVQRDLGHDMVLAVDWARRQGENVNLGEQDLNRYATHTADGLQPIIPKCATTPDFNPADQCSSGGITFWVPEGRSVYDGLLVKLQKRFSHHYQFTASYAMQKLLSESAAVNLDNYFAGYGPTLARHNLNVAGVVNLPYGVRLSVNSSIISATPVNPVISGIDLNGAGNTSFPLFEAVSGLSYNCFEAGCSKSQLASAVSSFNSTWAGKKALNGATVPTLTLPSNYDFGSPIISQDFRITKEFAYHERYKLQVFGEFFNAFNISNLTYGAFTLNSPTTFGQPTARVGQASTFGSGGPRAIQVGGRFSF